MSAETWSKVSSLPVNDTTEQVSNTATEPCHDGEGGQSSSVVARLTDVEEVRAARRLAGVTAAVEQDDAEDRQRDAVRRQTARLHRSSRSLVPRQTRIRRLFRRRLSQQLAALFSQLATTSVAVFPVCLVAFV